MSLSEILNTSLKECKTHILRIRFAKTKLQDRFPLSVDQWRSLDDETIEAMDQLVYRFTKLQDAIGLRVFPHLLKALEEPMESSSMIDKLNRLEKLGALPSKQKWQELRNLRNSLAHEYADQDEENCERFHYFLGEVDELVRIFDHLDRWISSRH